MSLCLTPRIERIARAVTGRAAGLFDGDVERRRAALDAALRGRRVLVAGGAGSIGAATIGEILAFAPSALSVLDPAENNLAELIRGVRSGALAWSGELTVEPLDYGGGLAARWLAEQPPFDVVLSFAALKHVRSERDRFSLARMLEVNLLAADRFLAAVRRHGHGRSGVFLVSTDKAARPVSLMGASKRAMELLLWAHAQPGAPASLVDGGAAPPLARATTTRFANVAFSDGSLPWGFLQRLEKRQPLAAPSDVRRYLVSPREAGRLCLLAALANPHRHVLIPRLDPVRDVVGFDAIAAATLADAGLEPAWFHDEAEARDAVEREAARGRWPVLLTASDTSGEKELEEFVADGERALEVGLDSARAIAAPAVDRGPIAALLRLVADAVAGAVPTKEAIVAALARIVPDLAHRDTGLCLDRKM